MFAHAWDIQVCASVYVHAWANTCIYTSVHTFMGHPYTYICGAYIYMHTNICTHACTCMRHTHICTHVCTCMGTHTHCMCVGACTYMHLCMYMCGAHMYRYLYTYIHGHTHICTCIHTFAGTHIYAPMYICVWGTHIQVLAYIHSRTYMHPYT